MHEIIKSEQREQIVKFLLCAALSLTAGRIIGHPETPTIGVSSILMLYTNRGFAGYVTYNRKRIMTQAIMGGLSFVFISLFRRVLPVGDWVIAVLTVCVCMVIGLTIEYRRSFSPLTVTLGNAAFIMTMGILYEPRFYPDRVLYCVMGAVIALFVNNVIMPVHNRYKEISEEVLRDSLGLLSAPGPAGEEALRAGVAQKFEFIDKHMLLMEKDRKRKQYYIPETDFQRLRLMYALQKDLLLLEGSLREYGAEASETFMEEFLPIAAAVRELHGRLIAGPEAGDAGEKDIVQKFRPKSEAEVHLLHSLLEYRKNVNLLAEMQTAKGLAEKFS